MGCGCPTGSEGVRRRAEGAHPHPERDPPARTHLYDAGGLGAHDSGGVGGEGAVGGRAKPSPTLSHLKGSRGGGGRGLTVWAGWPADLHGIFCSLGRPNMSSTCCERGGTRGGVGGWKGRCGGPRGGWLGGTSGRRSCLLGGQVKCIAGFLRAHTWASVCGDVGWRGRDYG